MPGFLAPVMETCMGVTPDTSCTFHIIMGEHDIPTGDSVTCYGNGASLFVDLTETGTNESEFRGPGGETCATKVIAPDPGGESLTEQWTDAAGNTLVVRSGKETISVDCPGNVTELYDPKELVGVDCLPSLPAGSRCPKGSCD